MFKSALHINSRRSGDYAELQPDYRFKLSFVSTHRIRSKPVELSSDTTPELYDLQWLPNPVIAVSRFSIRFIRLCPMEQSHDRDAQRPYHTCGPR